MKSLDCSHPTIHNLNSLSKTVKECEEEEGEAKPFGQFFTSLKTHFKLQKRAKIKINKKKKNFKNTYWKEGCLFHLWTQNGALQETKVMLAPA